MSVKALIFDMDGTIADNMHLHDEAWTRWLTGTGLPPKDAGHFTATAGMSNAEIFARDFPQIAPEDVLHHVEIKEGHYRDLLKTGLKPVNGLLALLDEADRLGLPMAVATAAPPGNIDVVLDPLGIRARFKTIVYPQLGYRGKPHPDMFLAAAEKMGVAPENCLVFEDAPYGLEAARRAGMKVIALTTTLGADAFTSYDNRLMTVPDFTHVPLKDLV